MKNHLTTSIKIIHAVVFLVVAILAYVVFLVLIAWVAVHCPYLCGLLYPQHGYGHQYNMWYYHLIIHAENILASFIPSMLAAFLYVSIFSERYSLRFLITVSFLTFFSTFFIARVMSSNYNHLLVERYVLLLLEESVIYALQLSVYILFFSFLGIFIGRFRRAIGARF